jgi:hypothetical protein
MAQPETDILFLPHFKISGVKICPENVSYFKFVKVIIQFQCMRKW